MNRTICTLAIGSIVASVAVAVAAPTATSKTTVVELKMVKFAQSKLRTKVGSGECTDLVIAAMKAAGARPGDLTNQADYHWGRSRGQITTKIRPGDIIQFEGCVFKSTTTTATGGTRSSEQDMPHHTAIVEKEIGHHVHLLQQNTDGDITKSVVHENSLDLRTLKSGHYTVWTPIPQ